MTFDSKTEVREAVSGYTVSPLINMTQSKRYKAEALPLFHLYTDSCGATLVLIT